MCLIFRIAQGSTTDNPRLNTKLPSYRAPESSDAVDGDGVERVVDLPLDLQVAGVEEERAAHGAHQDGRPRVVDVAAGAEGHGA